MKRLLVVLSVLFGAALFFTACSEETADLGWENGSAGSINDIVWSGDGTEWANGDEGYDVDQKTGSKEVTGLTGNVDCTLDDGYGFDEADVIVENNNNSNVLSLNAGEAYEYTIVATAKKK